MDSVKGGGRGVKVKVGKINLELGEFHFFGRINFAGKGVSIPITCHGIKKFVLHKRTNLLHFLDYY